MNARMNRFAVSAGLAIAAASVAAASTYQIDWLQMAPTAFGSAPPTSGTYNLPGVGQVQMTYATDPDLVDARSAVGALVTGSVNYGSDTYTWNNHEEFARTNWAFSGILNTGWQVTYTFPGTVPAGQIILGVQGLGRRNANPGENPQDCITTATVQQNGTFLGDYINGNWGATQYTGGPGTFSMQNSQTGWGGADPWWNTGLGLVRIDDATNSLTVRFAQTAGDGVGVNIGVLVPEPSSAGLLALGGVVTFLRRRR
ncbi:MAG: PEP-CTERM sorting domain-containing protein [Phycisphaerales bacterium]|nr:PEP-CTERM sorting domain-containing protein [Phycisphaerales bacterium]